MRSYDYNDISEEATDGKKNIAEKGVQVVDIVHKVGQLVHRGGSVIVCN